jgi:hypothetical protein
LLFWWLFPLPFAFLIIDGDFWCCKFNLGVRLDIL